MIGLGIALLAVGGADLVAGGLAGQPPRRRAAGLAAAFVIAATVSAAAGAGRIGVVLVPAVAVAGTWAWQAARRGERPAGRRAWLALGVLAMLLVVALLAGIAGGFRGGVLLALLGLLDVPALAGQSLGRVLVLAGAAVALTATANAVVRLLLVVAGPGVSRSGSRLRGGRLIGPLERLLVFGLASAGQAEAATLVVAAKALLRFPELSALARVRGAAPPDPAALRPLPQVDALTEYLLVGSLASWLLAFGAAAVIA